MWRLLLLLVLAICLMDPAAPVSNRLLSASAARMRAVASVAAGGDVVCTHFLQASFRTMFLVRDDPSQVAEDENGMCDLCLKVVRFGVINVNDPRYRANYKQIIRDRACHFEDTERTKDCKVLTEAIIKSQGDWFSSEAAKFTADESNSTYALQVSAQRKSEHFCRNVRCCRRLRPNSLAGTAGSKSAPTVNLQNTTNITSNAVWANLTPQQQRQVLEEDRANINKDTELLDVMKDNLDRFQKQLNMFRDKLNAKEKNVASRERDILTGVLRERMIVKAKAMEELARAQAERLRIQQELDDKQAAQDELFAKTGKTRPGARKETPEERDARIARMKARKAKKELDEAAAAAAKKTKEALAKQAAAAAAATAAPSAAATTSTSPTPAPSPSTDASKPSFRSLRGPAPQVEDSEDAEDGDEDADEEGGQEEVAQL